jgi:hypothetical protein
MICCLTDGERLHAMQNMTWDQLHAKQRHLSADSSVWWEVWEAYHLKYPKTADFVVIPSATPSPPSQPTLKEDRHA